MSLEDVNLADETWTPTLTIPDLNGLQSSIGSVAPASNSNQSGGFGINQVISALTNMFDGGVAAYNNVARTLGTAQIGPTVVTPVAAASVLGLSQQQWLIIGGGAALIAVLLIVKRR